MHLEQLAYVEVRRMKSGSSSLRSGSVRQNSSLGLESIMKETKNRILRQSSEKSQDSINEVPPSQAINSVSTNFTELKTKEQALAVEERSVTPLSPTVLIKQKVNFILEDSNCPSSPVAGNNFVQFQHQQTCFPG